MKNAVFGAVVSLLVAVPFAASAATGPVYASATAQVNVLEACKAALGISNELAVTRLDFNDGRVLITAVNRNGITLRQARALNACKHASLEANPGAWDGPRATPVSARGNDLPVTAPKTRVVTGTDDWRSTACPRNFNGMFRGSLYCVNGKPIR